MIDKLSECIENYGEERINEKMMITEEKYLFKVDDTIKKLNKKDL